MTRLPWKTGETHSNEWGDLSTVLAFNLINGDGLSVEHFLQELLNRFRRIVVDDSRRQLACVSLGNERREASHGTSIIPMSKKFPASGRRETLVRLSSVYIGLLQWMTALSGDVFRRGPLIISIRLRRDTSELTAVTPVLSQQQN